MRWIGYGSLALSGLVLAYLLAVLAELVPSPGFYVTSLLKYADPFLWTIGIATLALERIFRTSRATVALEDGNLAVSVMNRWLRIPIGDICGIAIEVKEPVRCRFDASGPLPARVPSNASSSLLVQVPDGWVRLLTELDAVQHRWLVGRLGQEFDIGPLTSSTPLRKPKPVAELGQLTRLMWWACVFTLPLVGGMAGWTAWSEVRMGVISRGWPTVQAVVLESEYEADARHRPRGMSYGDRTVNFRYRYEINGEVFESNRISYEIGSDTPIVQSLVEEHPAGSKVTVHYDPANPERATALTGVDPRLVGLSVISATVFIAGTIWLPFAYPRAGRAKLQRAYFDRGREWKAIVKSTPWDD